MSKEIAEVIDLTEARFREVATSRIDYAAEKGPENSRWEVCSSGNGSSRIFKSMSLPRT